MIHWSAVIIAIIVAFAAGMGFAFLIVVKAVTEAVEDFFERWN